MEEGASGEGEVREDEDVFVIKDEDEEEVYDEDLVGAVEGAVEEISEVDEKRISFNDQEAKEIVVVVEEKAHKPHAIDEDEEEDEEEISSSLHSSPSSEDRLADEAPEDIFPDTGSLNLDFQLPKLAISLQELPSSSIISSLSESAYPTVRLEDSIEPTPKEIEFATPRSLTTNTNSTNPMFTTHLVESPGAMNDFDVQVLDVAKEFGFDLVEDARAVPEVGSRFTVERMDEVGAVEEVCVVEEMVEAEDRTNVIEKDAEEELPRLQIEVVSDLSDTNPEHEGKLDSWTPKM